jgi:hypothetical protein
MKHNHRKVKMRSKIMIFIVTLYVISCAHKSVFLTPDDISEISTTKKAMTVYFQTFDDEVYALRQISVIDDGIVGRGQERSVDTISLSNIRMAWYEYESAEATYLVAAAPVFIVGGLLIHGMTTAPSPPPSDCCPICYSYDGDKYWLDAEPFGGSFCEGLKRSDWCSLEYLQDDNHEYKIKIVNELDEDQYIDEMKLLVVDHPSNTQVFPDVHGEIHGVSNTIEPSYARTNHGHDIKHLIMKDDYRTWQGDLNNVVGIKDTIIIQFPKPKDAREVKLLINCGTTLWGAHMGQKYISLHGTQLDSWYSEIDRKGQAFVDVLEWYYNEETYLMALRIKNGVQWETVGVIYGAGPVVTETKVYCVDISQIQGDSMLIMLTPPVGFWQIGYIAADYSTGHGISIVELNPIQALTDKGRDVSLEIESIDNNYLVLDSVGMAVDLVFPAGTLESHTARSLILKATGYYKIHIKPDGEPKTALIDRLNYDTGYAIKYALQEYENWIGNKR